MYHIIYCVIEQRCEAGTSEHINVNEHAIGNLNILKKRETKLN